MLNSEIRTYTIPHIKTGIRIESLPDKTMYEIGEPLNLEGMVVMLDYQDGDSNPIDDYIGSGDLSAAPGKRL